MTTVVTIQINKIKAHKLEYICTLPLLHKENHLWKHKIATNTNSKQISPTNFLTEMAAHFMYTLQEHGTLSPALSTVQSISWWWLWNKSISSICLSLGYFTIRPCRQSLACVHCHTATLYHPDHLHTAQIQTNIKFVYNNKSRSWLCKFLDDDNKYDL